MSSIEWTWMVPRLFTDHGRGTGFINNGIYNKHINTIISKCRRSYYSLTTRWMAYPRWSKWCKTYFGKLVCTSVLVYGTYYISNDSNNVKGLDIAQGNLFKELLGLNKHKAELLMALNLRISRDILNGNILSQYKF